MSREHKNYTRTHWNKSLLLFKIEMYLYTPISWAVLWFWKCMCLVFFRTCYLVIFPSVHTRLLFHSFFVVIHLIAHIVHFVALSFASFVSFCCLIFIAVMRSTFSMPIVLLVGFLSILIEIVWNFHIVIYFILLFSRSPSFSFSHRSHSMQSKCFVVVVPFYLQ